MPDKYDPTVCSCINPVYLLCLREDDDEVLRPPPVFTCNERQGLASSAARKEVLLSPIVKLVSSRLDT